MKHTGKDRFADRGAFLWGGTGFSDCGFRSLPWKGHAKQGVLFGFRMAYDTRDDILYCADGVTRIIWHKSEAPAIYVSKLLDRRLFVPGRPHTEVRETDKEEEGTR